jgi:hypothetical protein
VDDNDCYLNQRRRNNNFGDQGFDLIAKELTRLTRLSKLDLEYAAITAPDIIIILSSSH